MIPKFVRPNVREMEGYTPGEQPAPGTRIIKLNTNENPYPPSPAVMQAIRDLPAESLRRYPQPMSDTFRQAVAKVLPGVTPEMVLAGNGSDDILTIATRTFVPPDGKLAAPEPTYSLYPVLARLEDANYVGVPWAKGYQLPIEALIATGAAAIYLANPNAPTGTIVSPKAVSELATAFNGLLLVDEAYVDFADENCLALVRDHANVVVSRTLSKAYSLAGLRFGYAIAQPQIIEQMVKVKDSYNCDALSIVAASAAVLDQEYARSTWTRIKSERTRLNAALIALGWDVLPSQSNFLFARPPNGGGKAMYLGLKQKGILVRYFSGAGLADRVRITVGTPEQNDEFLAAVRA